MPPFSRPRFRGLPCDLACEKAGSSQQCNQRHASDARWFKQTFGCGIPFVADFMPLFGDRRTRENSKASIEWSMGDPKRNAVRARERNGAVES